MRYVTSREACKILGLHANTLRTYANDGRIETIKTYSGQRRYNVDTFIGSVSEQKRFCYCRVSSPKQRDDLERQVAFMSERYPDYEVIRDIGSGINFKRKGLTSILESAMRGDVVTLVVAHKDRLTRFGFELIKYIIERNGGKLVVLDQAVFSPEVELTKDLLSILHVFSCRLHGLRNYKKQVSENISNGESKTDIP